MGRAKRKQNVLTSDQARRGIYLDFEGRLPKEGVEQPPILAGVLCEEEWRQVIVAERFFGIAHHNSPRLRHPAISETSRLQPFLEDLARKAISEQRLIIAFSSREETVFLDQALYEGIEDLCVDGRPTLVRAVRRSGLEVPRLGKRTLDFYRSALGDGPLPKHLSGKHDWLGKIEREITAPTNKGDFGPGRKGRGSSGKRAWTNQRNRNARDCFDLRLVTVRA